MSGATYTVERSAVIAAPPAKVYAALIDFHDWVNWSPWEELDPDLQRTYSGSPTGVGSAYAWTGNRKAGEGRMTITEASEPANVTIALEFLKPFKSSNTTTFDLRPEGEGTNVTWRMVGPRTFMIKVMGIFKSMDSMVGKDFENGLERLAAHLES